MTVPQHPEPEATTPGRTGRWPEGRAAAARDWALVAGFVSDISLPHDELVAELGRLLDTLVGCLVAEPFDAAPAAEVGEELVRLNVVGDEALQASMELVGRVLLDVHAARVPAVLSGVAAGYARVLQQRTLVTQEVITRALLRAKEEVERVLQASEERFREVFTASAVGILISDLDGNVIQHNAAFRDMLGHLDTDLAGSSVFDLFDPESVPAMRGCYADVFDGVVRRARRPARLVGNDGEIVWTLLSISLLHDSDGRPVHYLTMVDNVSDLHLLAENVSRQNLYDVLTGLPNRRFLVNRLAELTGGPEPVLTLCHIDLDGLGLINNGLGAAAGDLVLRVVAGRLRQAFPDAILARLGGDDFAVLVAHDDPEADSDVLALVRRINHALDPPVEIDHQPVAVSATIGVVGRRGADVSAEELLREAETTVRRLKSRDRVQWGMFDEHQDAVDRERARLVAAMPAALAAGGIEAVFQPVVRLTTLDVMAVEARLEWVSTAFGVQDHNRCAALAEETPLALTVGRWLLDAAARRARTWTDERGPDAPPVVVNLSARQAGDPDLISTVTEVVKDTGVDVRRLRIGLPAAEVARPGSDAEDNAQVLDELGVPVVLHGVGADHAHLVGSGLKVRGLVLADDVLARLGPVPDAGSLPASVLAHLVPLVRAGGLRVGVRGVTTGEQADWLRGIGVDAAQGVFFDRVLLPVRTERSH